MDRDATPPGQWTSDERAVAPPAGDRAAASRRALLISVLASAPAVVVMGNRPAWAVTGCVAPSAWLSVQVAQNNGITLSHQPSTGSFNQGRGPAYWKLGYSSTSPYSVLSTQPSDHKGNSYPTSSTKFSTIFGSGSTQTFGLILCTMSTSSYYHWAAAYLSALNNNGSGAAGITKFPLTTAQVIAMYNGTFSTNATTWTSSEGLSYIQTLEG